MENVFYWNRIKGKYSIDIITKAEGVKKATICTAYISPFGVKQLKSFAERNELTKSRIEVFVSKEFNQVGCGKILDSLSMFCNVYIYSPEEDVLFHPKFSLYQMKDGSIEYSLGSANFTKGGLENNIELVAHRKANEEEANCLKRFIDMVKFKSELVTYEIIKKYYHLEKELVEIASYNKKLRKKYLRIFRDEKDPFSENAYELEDQYFSYADYEVFFERNIEKKDLPRRVVVKEKLLCIHEKIESEIKEKGLNVYVHWNKKNITSQINPTQFNHHQVSWMGVRYGKHEDELKKFWDEMGKNDDEAFHKHACLQYSISEKTFEVNLFHAVPHGAHDRFYVHQKINDEIFKEKLIAALRKIEGKGLSWQIGDKVFELEKNSSTKFIKFYQLNDIDGEFSYLSRSFQIDDKKISKKNIVDTIINSFVELYPLYSILAKRY